MIKIFLIKTLTILFVALTAVGQEPATDVRPLPIAGAAVERRIKSGETHFYNFSAAKGEFWQVRVEQRGSDVVLRLRDDRGNLLKETDSPNGQAGWEVLSFVFDKAGEYKLEVSAFPVKEENPAQSSPSGYVLQIKNRRVAAPADLRRIEIERVFGEAVAARSSENDDVFAESIPKFEIALAGWRELKDDYFAELTARQIDSLKEAEKKPSYRALRINTKIERRIKPEQPHIYTIELQAGAVLHVDLAEQGGFNCELLLVDPSGKKILVKSDYGTGKELETGTLIADKAGAYSVGIVPGTFSFEGRYNLTATVKSSAAETDKWRVNAEQSLLEAVEASKQTGAENVRRARAKLENAVSLWKKLNDTHWTATALELLANSLYNSGEKDKALDSYRQAAQFYETAANLNRRADCLNRIGRIYADRNEKSQALENYLAALVIYQKTGNSEGAGLVYFNLGMLANSLGERREALKFYRQAAAIFKENYALRDEANTTARIAGVHLELREFGEAVANYNAALNLFQTLGDKLEIGKTLLDIGLVHDGLYQPRKAFDFYKQALPILRETGDKNWEAVALNNIAATYSDLGETSKALEFHEQALALRRNLDDKETLLNSLTNVGAAHSNLGDKQRALQFHNEALNVARAVGSKQFEAAALHNVGSVHLGLGEVTKGLEFLNQALEMRRALKNQADISSTLNAVGYAYRIFGEMKKALEFYQEALEISLENGDKLRYATALNNIGQVYDDFDEDEKALGYFNQSLALRREIGDKEGESWTLNNIGAVYRDLEEYEKSLEFFNKSLEFKLISDNKFDEAAAFSNIAIVYSVSGDNQKALEFLNRALPLREAAGDKIGVATTLNNFGIVYSNGGDKSKAVDYFNRSLRLRRTIGDKSGTATSLINIGSVFSSLNEQKIALEYYFQALEIEREIGGKRSQANVHNSIGSSYLQLKEWKKAADSYNQSLALYQQLESYSGTATALNSIGALLNRMGEKQEALNYFKKALPIYETIDDNGGRAQVLNNMGAIRFDLGEKQKAVELYQQALPLRRLAADLDGEAATLGNLMWTYESLGRKELAIAFGKKAVGIRLELRGKARDFDNETQKRDLQDEEFVYRRLTGLLLAENRLSEAHQIFNSFKDQQFFDFTRETQKQILPLELNRREKSFTAEYERANAKFADSARDAQRLKRGSSNRQPSAAETEEIKKLESVSQNAAAALQSFLRRAETDFAEPSTEKPLETADTREMQATLRELAARTGQKAAALYTLAGKDEFRVLLVAADRTATAAHKITRLELNQKAVRFWTTLRSPLEDPTILGGELHSIIFKTIEAELPAGTTTILWSLDGNLRYVPMPALHDGKQYLIEKYRHTVFTRADRRQMTAAVSPVWTATGFGSAKQHTVELLGERTNFNALPAVTDELDAIFKTGNSANGIFAGEVFPDASFTKPAMLEALRKKRPLVHIASHFAFRPGDDARSFLLMGDGTAFTLAEMKREKVLFDGVELLTLSACNTAAVRPDADGREVDGFAELAQRLGANSVLASLWAVADESTQLLMSEFYRLRKANPKLTKADALQAAQRAMIAGKLKSSGKASGCRSDVINFGDTQTGFKCDTNAPFAHPYFWSPFVLFGNWK